MNRRAVLVAAAIAALTAWVSRAVAARRECPACYGSGEVVDQTGRVTRCRTCGGKGTINT